MKKLLKSLFASWGYTLYNSKDLPPGINLALDIKKISRNLQVKTVFDVGANIGQTAIRYSELFPEANIFSFEPIKDTFHTLSKNTQSLQQVQAFNLALGSQEKQEEIYLQSNSQLNSLSSQVNTPTSNNTSEVITITTLDRFCQKHQIETVDLIKTDTEGFDLEVLKGSATYLAENRIRFIISEVGFSPTDKRHTFFCDIYNLLLENNFKFYAIYEPVHKISQVVQGEKRGLSYGNALFINPHLLNRD